MMELARDFRLLSSAIAIAMEIAIAIAVVLEWSGNFAFS